MTTDPIEDYRARLRAASEPLDATVRADLLEDVHGHLEEIRRTAGSEAEIRTALDRLGPPEEIVHAAASDGGNVAPSAATAPPVAPDTPARMEADTATMPRASGPTSGSGGVRGRDTTAILLVVFGAVGGALIFAFLPPVMPVAAIGAYVTGLVLLWSSASWTSGEKLFASLVWPGGVAAPLLLGVMNSRTCMSESSGGGIETSSGEIVERAGEVVTTCTGFAFHPAIGIPLFVVLFAAPIVIGMVLMARASRRATAA